MVHILASLATHQQGSYGRIQKAILVGSLTAVPREYDTTFLSNLDVSSLHLIGLKDTRVVPTKQRQLADRFVDATIMEHDKGHVVPQQSAQCEQIIQYILQ